MSLFKGLVTKQVPEVGTVLIPCLRREKLRRNIMNFVFSTYMSILIYNEETQ